MSKSIPLKEIVGFLPYGLKGKTYSEKEPWAIVGFEMDNSFPEYPTLKCNHSTYKNTINIWSKNIKPIVRPLSYLTKEITHNGENFVPIDKICEIFPVDIDENGVCCNGTDEFEIKNLPFSVIEKLHKWHFDIFYWIKDGLAVDMNTI